jgi:hypothetical protein
MTSAQQRQAVRDEAGAETLAQARLGQARKAGLVTQAAIPAAALSSIDYPLPLGSPAVCLALTFPRLACAAVPQEPPNMISASARLSATRSTNSSAAATPCSGSM